MNCIEKIKEIYNVFISLLSDDNYIYYIAGTEKLPEILNSEDEHNLLIKLSNNDMESKNILVEKNLRLVVYIAKKFENSGINIEDLISIGTIGLIKGINSYNLEKNIKLATYASRCIENEILMYLRKNNKIKNEISIDEPINIDSEGNNLSLGDILGTDIDIIFKSIEDNDNEKVLKKAITKLNNREKIIMQMRYGLNGLDELTQKEVADKLRYFTIIYFKNRKKSHKSSKKRFFI
jgi:RNA polymerase sporulation-specific sigma factor